MKNILSRKDLKRRIEEGLNLKQIKELNLSKRMNDEEEIKNNLKT